MARNISALWEASYPYIIALIADLWIIHEPIDTPIKLNQFGFSLPNLFGALSSFNTFGAGVTITIFVFTMAPAAGFIAKMEKLHLYETFRRYALEASVTGVVAGILCMPIYAATPLRMTEGLFPLITVTASLFSMTFALLFYRVSRIFLFWSAQR